jgi:pimeloyl-ACP methyl ester carboxylesterase
MVNVQPANCKTRFIDLPLSRLHVMETGEGEPLFMVPATISELENWRTLAQFMAQWFHVYFFELPGHGKSEPFKGGFSSQKVAGLVGQLADKLGYERFNLMGFSFGGILAVQTFKIHSHRIDRMILIAPCLGRPALPFSSLRLSVLHKANQLLSHPKFREKFVDLIHDPRTISKVVRILQKVGKLEDNIPLQQKLPRTKSSTVEVLTAQVNEILTTDFHTELGRYDTPCYFAMSVHDPLLRFETTKSILQGHFTNLSTVQLDYPFHQPPRPFTYKELNHDFSQSVDAFVQPKDTQGVRHGQQKVDYRAADRISSDRNVDPSPAADRIPAMSQ